jgi:hypothetical protein
MHIVKTSWSRSMFAGMTFKDWFSVFTSVVGVFVIPFTLVGIWRSRVVSQQADNWKARQEEIGTYNDINTRYAEFLRMLLANPDVDIGEFETPRKLANRTERYKRNLMYAVLVSIMERAFLLYTAIDRFENEQLSQERTVLVKLLDGVERSLFGRHPKRYETHIFKSQWPGWLRYFQYYCSHDAFREYWMATVPGEAPGVPTQWHDTDFEAFVTNLMRNTGGAEIPDQTKKIEPV